MTISERIFDLLEKKNLDYKYLEKATGIKYNTICDWKRKKTNPTADKIMSICRALHVTPEYILEGDPDEDDVLIGNDFHREIEEIRLLQFYRRLSAAQRELVWSTLEVVKKVRDEKDEKSSD